MSSERATAAVTWVDPTDGERVTFTVTYSVQRARSVAIDKVLVPGSRPAPRNATFAMLIDTLAGRAGGTGSALLLDWDVLDDTEVPAVKLPLSRSSLESLPESLLRAIVAAISAGVAGKRRRSNIFRRETYASDMHALSEQGRLDEAIALARAARRSYPRLAGPWFDLGSCLLKAGDNKGADVAFTRALHLGGDNAADIYRWRGFSRARRGRLAEGFADLEVGETGAPDAPRWAGACDPTATVLVLDGARYGYGDSLMFARYLPLVRERVKRVVLACLPPLVTLYESSRVADQIIAGADLHGFSEDRLEQPGHLIVLPGGLPPIFTRSLDTIPPPAVLTPPPLNDELAALLGPDDGLRVGLVWANGHHGAYERRSMDLATLEPLGRVTGVTYFALQKGPRSEQGLTPPSPFGRFVNVGPLLPNFADTAALVQQLDLVISVDTAVAHLAGTLGVPTWTLLPRVADWRWFTGRDDSPWYPSMRLFRQERVDDWGLVVERVRDTLMTLAQDRKGLACRPR